MFFSSSCGKKSQKEETMIRDLPRHRESFRADLCLLTAVVLRLGGTRGRCSFSKRVRFLCLWFSRMEKSPLKNSSSCCGTWDAFWRHFFSSAVPSPFQRQGILRKGEVDKLVAEMFSFATVSWEDVSVRKLVATSATLVVTGALLVITKKLLELD